MDPGATLDDVREAVHGLAAWTLGPKRGTREISTSAQTREHLLLAKQLADDYRHQK